MLSIFSEFIFRQALQALDNSKRIHTVSEATSVSTDDIGASISLPISVVDNETAAQALEKDK